jgi:hypothetical protein
MVWRFIVKAPRSPHSISVRQAAHTDRQHTIQKTVGTFVSTEPQKKTNSKATMLAVVRREKGINWQIRSTYFAYTACFVFFSITICCCRFSAKTPGTLLLII